MNETFSDKKKPAYLILKRKYVLRVFKHLVTRFILFFLLLVLHTDKNWMKYKRWHRNKEMRRQVERLRETVIDRHGKILVFDNIL